MHQGNTYCDFCRVVRLCAVADTGIAICPDCLDEAAAAADYRPSSPLRDERDDLQYENSDLKGEMEKRERRIGELEMENEELRREVLALRGPSE